MQKRNSLSDAEIRALVAMAGDGIDEETSERVLASLRRAELRLLDVHHDLACRWVDVRERPVPPDADTIIRTLTRTIDGRSWSATYWLDGLRAPAMPGPG